MENELGINDNNQLDSERKTSEINLIKESKEKIVKGVIDDKINMKVCNEVADMDENVKVCYEEDERDNATANSCMSNSITRSVVASSFSDDYFDKTKEINCVVEHTEEMNSNTEKNEEKIEKKYTDEIVDDADLEKKAEGYKEQGNKQFASCQYKQALKLYTCAIDALEDHSNPKSTNLHIYYTNRAFCNIKLENYGSAILDSESALETKRNFSKAYYRRACAYFCLGKYKDAINDFEVVSRLSKDKDVLSKLNECKKIIRTAKFAAAISNEKSLRPSETADLTKIIIESDYKGPVYDRNNLTDKFLEDVIEYIKVPGNVLHRRYVYMIILDCIKEFKKLKTLERITILKDSKFTVCGDIHGQFYDLLNIFKINGLPSTLNPYLFNGDFVDRGSFSAECVLTLFLAKLIYPQHVHLARGNHETQTMNKLYGFQGEILAKYNNDDKLYSLFSECFCQLPLAHLLNEKVFVVHGGLFSRDAVTLKEIEEINRDCEPPDSGLMTEMLWSDPQIAHGRSPSKRGVACEFGPDVTKQFLLDNKLKYIIRSHEMKEKGYHVEHDGKLITVFSAPNYCDQIGNDGAFITMSGEDLEPNFVTFSAVEHPPSRPMKFANPFLGLL